MFACGQLLLSPNQVVGFFDYQYLWKESSELNFFFGMEIIIKESTFETAALGFMWPDSRIIWLSIPLERINSYHCLSIVNLFYLFVS